MTTTHGTPPRGLNATRSPLFEGRFGRMFRNLPRAEFGKNDEESGRNLHVLGNVRQSGIVIGRDRVVGHLARQFNLRLGEVFKGE